MYKKNVTGCICKKEPLKMSLNPFTPTDQYGMFQIKAWTIPF